MAEDRARIRDVVTDPAAAGGAEDLARLIARLDPVRLRREFIAHGEFLALPGFVPAALLEELLDGVARTRHAVHRNYIPGHKQGGSVARHVLDEIAPAFGALYRNASLKALFETLAARPLLDCPARDPHAYALYFYTEPGDHIGYHYDTSYYRGARYTALVGLIDRSTARLVYRLHTRDGSGTEEQSMALEPGALVFFNGDLLEHKISPLGRNEERIALTLEYVTDDRMNPFLRFVSDMKDAIAYFGFGQVFGSRRGK